MGHILAEDEGGRQVSKVQGVCGGCRRLVIALSTRIARTVGSKD
jgi:hypothetical protein